MAGRCQFATMSRWRAEGGLLPKQHAALMAGRRRAYIMFLQLKQRNANDMHWCLLTLCFKSSQVKSKFSLMMDH